MQQVDTDGARPNNVVGDITKGIGNVKNSLGAILDKIAPGKVIAKDADDPSYKNSAINPNAG